MATNVSTIGSGLDYETPTLWEADTDNDLVSAGDIEVGELNDDFVDSAEFSVLGATTDASNYRLMRPDAGNEYDPVAGTGRSYRINNTGDGFDISEAFFRLQDLLIIDNATAVGVRVHAAAGSVLIQRIFVRSLAGDGIRISDDNCIVRNCIVDLEANAETKSCFAVQSSTGNVMQNCVAYSCEEDGFSFTSAATLQNCAAVDNTENDFATSGGTETNNLSSDTTAPGTSSQQSKSAASTFTDAANEDFTLVAGSAAIDNGVDLSGTFTDDIVGNSRSGTWDIGAYVFPLPGGPAPFLPVRIRQNAINPILVR